jgi:glycosyltransferase involved in cell wall biosynthesis
MTTTQAAPDVSVIIPCYNEEKNLEHGVMDEVHQYLNDQSIGWEVLVVNDASTDRSRELVTAFIEDKSRYRLLDIPHGGKPAAVWAGIQAAQGDIILFTDMDQSTPISEWDKLQPWYGRGYDVVIGSRGRTREGSSIVRKLGSLVFLTLRQLVLLEDIRDTQCGFKSCRRHVALEVFPELAAIKAQDQPTGWKVSAYDVELLHLCEKAGYQIREVNVSWKNRDLSDTKAPEGTLTRYLRESLEMAKEILRVKVNDLKGYYDR